jgi:hypothetical protein
MVFPSQRRDLPSHASQEVSETNWHAKVSVTGGRIGNAELTKMHVVPSNSAHFAKVEVSMGHFYSV